MADGVERDAALLAASFAGGAEEPEEVEVMEDSGEDDDIPTIRVGQEEFDITDVTHDIIARCGGDMVCYAMAQNSMTWPDLARPSMTYCPG